VIVRCEQVSKRFGEKLAVDALDLEVDKGQCFGLLGPNGAGKTTALKMIYGVTPPSAGRILVFDQDITTHTREIRARLGVTLQENALIEVLSPVENLRVFGRYHLIPPALIDQRIDQLLDFLDLRSHAKLPVKALSGGFQRRLSIAMSLMNGPELLVLDEPTTGLDPAVRLALWNRVRELRRAGTTVLLTTHYMEEAERLCDALLVMDQGKAVARGSPRELIRDVLAPEALEVELPAGRHAAVLARLGGVRALRAGAHLMLYAKDATSLLETVRSAEPEAKLVAIRPTNLEDVFLALTGTKLEGGA
jgi:lipooligosaccharide transport system ATP-binding protein